MTLAKLVANPAEGHGLTQQITDVHFASAVKGEPVPLTVALVVLKQVGFGENETANGKHRHVRYEVIKLEPIIESGERTDALWKVQSHYEARTSTGKQRPLPIGLEGDERKVALLERIEDFADDNDLTGAELEQKWRDHFGVNDPDGNLYGIPGDYRKASVQYLLQFAIEIGAEKGSAAKDDGEPDPDDVPDPDAPPAVMTDEIGNALEPVDGE